MQKSKKHSSTLAVNKRAHYDFDILETFDAGLVLTGSEVKAVKNGHIKIVEAYITLKNTSLPAKKQPATKKEKKVTMSARTKTELYLTNAYISRYKPAGPDLSYDPTRPRKLLLHKKEIATLAGKKTQKGLTMVPLKVYTSRALVKVTFGLARGKKKYDKRQALKEREIKKRITSVLRQGDEGLR